jgi:hypothetical protein
LVLLVLRWYSVSANNKLVSLDTGNEKVFYELYYKGVRYLLITTIDARIPYDIYTLLVAILQMR